MAALLSLFTGYKNRGVSDDKLTETLTDIDRASLKLKGDEDKELSTTVSAYLKNMRLAKGYVAGFEENAGKSEQERDAYIAAVNEAVEYITRLTKEIDIMLLRSHRIGENITAMVRLFNNISSPIEGAFTRKDATAALQSLPELASLNLDDALNPLRHPNGLMIRPSTVQGEGGRLTMKVGGQTYGEDMVSKLLTAALVSYYKKTGE